jgi:hypothetical protein
LDEAIWSLTSPRARRISGSKNFRSPPRKDVCNSIGTKRTWSDVRPESAIGGSAEVEFRGRQVRSWTHRGPWPRRLGRPDPPRLIFDWVGGGPMSPDHAHVVLFGISVLRTIAASRIFHAAGWHSPETRAAARTLSLENVVFLQSRKRFCSPTGSGNVLV